MGIQSKLFLASLSASALLVGAMFLLMQWSVDRGMVRYVNQRQAEELQSTVDRLANHYQNNGSWDALRDGRTFDRVASGQRQPDDTRDHGRRGQPPPTGFDDGRRGEGPPHRGRHEAGGRDRRRPPSGPAGDGNDPRRLHLLDAEHNVIKGLQPDKDNVQIPIMLDDQLVGWLAYHRKNSVTEGFELQFLEQQREALLLISLLVFVAAALLSIPLARHLVGPIRRLAKGTSELAGGNFQVSLEEDRADELGQLAKNFNSLARTLQANEDARRRWFADISHELRTPLAILKGEIEALLDGIRPLSLERISSLSEEIHHLSRLVEDLYELSNSDIGALKYRKELVDFTALLGSVLDSHESLFNLRHRSIDRTAIPEGEALVWGDGVRLRQLLDNLLANSIKYSDDHTGLRVALAVDDQHLRLIIEDGPPGVSDGQLEQLFDHLYRTDSSRNRASGGSGLGLAICKRIVEGHEGEITAEHSTLGGVRIILTLPLTTS